MKVKVRVFGSLVEILDREFLMEAVDTQGLVTNLTEQYPALNAGKLLIAVNNTIAQENTVLREHDIVALMPPYSGG